MRELCQHKKIKKRLNSIRATATALKRDADEQGAGVRPSKEPRFDDPLEQDRQDERDEDSR